MKLLKEICRGSLLGVANIMRGSAGDLAISMGIYDKIIYAVTHLRKESEKQHPDSDADRNWRYFRIRKDYSFVIRWHV